MDNPKEIPLPEDQRQILDEVTAQAAEINARRSGVLMCIARLHGVANAAIDYRDGKLIVMPRDPKGDTK